MRRECLGDRFFMRTVLASDRCTRDWEGKQAGSSSGRVSSEGAGREGIGGKGSDVGSGGEGLKEGWEGRGAGEDVTDGDGVCVSLVGRFLCGEEGDIGLTEGFANWNCESFKKSILSMTCTTPLDVLMPR